ncbi:uncharacterized protein F4822DRAFT_441430 [Hypoxylon trugodes]|uniref:uncharacterized protein n=1 Tax=Hypoxylon trugodes TaxID=326681 RepID=UPI0021946AA9|nr:uncharacterized protein F4822DRAFT_441430 [Hypoxylon trugodes]KAI1392484.1 hypothetical protein F4822DRAFT_441430 [Hypoxylon trugodes]
MSLLSLAKCDVVKEHVILESLNFDRRPVRYSSIEVAHERTFNWVFQPSDKPDLDSTAGSVHRWLECGDGVFWISGKPGSGKSTLMKFISSHPQTRRALSTWSDPRPLVVASHFFWTQPDLIKISCIERWNQNAENIKFESWDTPELSRVLERIALCDGIRVRFCFFIDGLDEYEGDQVEFCQALRKLSISPHMKLCVSSRPWNVFEDSFGTDIASKLYIHELTKNDIHNFVRSSLEAHPRWANAGVKAKDAQSIMDEVTHRAAGVFLWVYLVVKQLRSGLTGYDNYSDLQRRLQTIPDDLGEFFKQILGSVEPFYHQRMARLLKISLVLKGPVCTCIYGFHDMEYENEDYALSLPVIPPGEDDIILSYSRISRRLNACCRGLLEVHPELGYVEFLHRTVVDYLNTKEMSEYLERKAGTTWNTQLSILRAWTAFIKDARIYDCCYHASCKTESILSELLVYARHLDGGSRAHQLLEGVDGFHPKVLKDRKTSLRSSHIQKASDSPFLREMVIKYSLSGYAKYISDKKPEYFSGFKLSAINDIITSLNPDDLADGRHCSRLAILQCVLEKSCNTNERFCFENTTWTPMKSFLIRAFRDNSWNFEQLLKSKTISLMLRHGGDPNAKYNTDEPIAWIGFSYEIIRRPLTPIGKALSLEVLDDFNTACTAVRHPSELGVKPMELKVPEASELNKDLCAFFDWSSRFEPLDQEFFLHITERILSIAKIYELDLECHLSTLKEIFPPQVISTLKDKISGSCLDVVEQPCTSSNNLALKRKQEYPLGDEGTYKKGKSA